MKSCQGCGSPVTDDYARVFGDNDNQVSSCPDCGMTYRGPRATPEVEG